MGGEPRCRQQGTARTSRVCEQAVSNTHPHPLVLLRSFQTDPFYPATAAASNQSTGQSRPAPRQLWTTKTALAWECRSAPRAGPVQEAASVSRQRAAFTWEARQVAAASAAASSSERPPPAGLRRPGPRRSRRCLPLGCPSLEPATLKLTAVSSHHE